MSKGKAGLMAAAALLLIGTACSDVTAPTATPSNALAGKYNNNGHPHFVFGEGNTECWEPGWDCHFVIAGVKKNASITVMHVASGFISWGCYNGSGDFPLDPDDPEYQPGGSTQQAYNWVDTVTFDPVPGEGTRTIIGDSDFGIALDDRAECDVGFFKDIDRIAGNYATLTGVTEKSTFWVTFYPFGGVDQGQSKTMLALGGN